MISLHEGSSSVPRSEVPTELVHLIIENLVVDNEDFRADLKSCSLVTKPWVPICRSYLFKEVEIGPIYTLQKRQFLVSILQKEPRLSNFIRKITFTSSSGEHTGNWADKSNCDKSLLALLQLPNVRNLSIKFSGGRNFATYMSDVQHFEWCSVMDRYLSTNQLTTISLIGLNNIDILSILSSQQLTTLQITNCEVVSILSSLPSLFAKQPSFQLKSLKARSVRNLCMPLLALCPHLEAMHLESLRFAKLDHDFDVPFVTTFPSLTTLNVGWVFDWEYPSTRQPFFPNIKSLELHYPFDASTLPQMCTLQSLQLEFDENEDTLDWDVFSKLVNDSYPGKSSRSFISNKRSQYHSISFDFPSRMVM
ncbi:hypothetical protein BJ165DRAFT_1473960 [Panaeolus papilionaceus]|nr:hypothetical protein BJ165DRAFT_1473960 [Panaeolus papilionaceus]